MGSNWVKGLIGIGMAILSGLGIADFFEHRETNKKIGMSLKELKESSAKDIQHSLVEKAVKNAADDKVSDYMRQVKNDVLADAKQKLSDETRRAVLSASEQIQKEVGERVATEASLIDMTALKKSARDKAEEKILDKFDGNLEDLLEKFNDNLSNIQKIYGGIADAISKGKEQDKSFKISL